MSFHNDYLYLIWKNPQTRRNYVIGKLKRGEKYTFEYCEEYNDAKLSGWRELDAFPNNQIYESEVIFPVFSSRLPDCKRRDIDKILKKYNLEYFDEFELLRRSGARLPIDTYEFIDPIFPEENSIQREFFVMGIRHNSPCSGINCSMFPKIKVGDFLKLEEEPLNENDSNAIRVLTQELEHLGYIPRYYNQAIGERLNRGVTYSCEVIEINSYEDCSECLKVRLNMPSIFD